jgi:hypothetical protein
MLRAQVSPFVPCVIVWSGVISNVADTRPEDWAAEANISGRGKMCIFHYSGSSVVVRVTLLVSPKSAVETHQPEASDIFSLSEVCRKNSVYINQTLDLESYRLTTSTTLNLMTKWVPRVISEL